MVSADIILYWSNRDIKKIHKGNELYYQSQKVVALTVRVKEIESKELSKTSNTRSFIFTSLFEQEKLSLNDRGTSVPSGDNF